MLFVFGMAGALFPGAGPCLAGGPPAVQSSLEREIEKTAARIQERTGFDLVISEVPDSGEPGITWRPASPEDFPVLLSFLQTLEAQLDKYPPACLSHYRGRKIYFVKTFFYGETPASGLYEERHTFVIFDFFRQRRHRFAQQHYIHHELYHLLALNHPLWATLRWEEFNPPGFVYGRPDIMKSRQENTVNPLAAAGPGFATHYAMTDIEEDKAELFACLMIPSQNRLIRKWAEKDRILKNKVDGMEDFLSRICPAWDAAFWADMTEKKD